MKFIYLIMISLLFSYCSSSPTKDEKPNNVEPTANVQKDDPKQKFLDLAYATSKNIKDLSDKSIASKTKALLNEAYVLLKLKKNEESIAKFEEAFEIGTDGEAYYKYGNALSNTMKLEESIKAYDIALELGYEKEYNAIYNKGCSYSLLKNEEEAFKNILLAVDRGYTAIPYMEKDPDLSYIRSLPEWKSKYKEIKKHAKEREEVVKSKG